MRAPFTGTWPPATPAEAVRPAWRAAVLLAALLLSTAAAAQGENAGTARPAPATAATATTAPDTASAPRPGPGAPKVDAVRHGMHKRGQLGSSAAFAPDGTLWVIGVDTYRRLVLWTSADRGRTFAPPRTLDTGSDVISADGESRPKLAFGPRGVVAIAYTQPLARPYTGEIRMLRSTDGGASFGAPFTVHQDRQVITHRFESIAFDAAGTLHVVWVDKRDMEAAKAAGRPYRGAAIYRTWSADGGASFAPDTRLADHSCECCRIALAPAPEGGLMAMWRHVFEPNLRDHAALRIGDQPTAKAQAPVRASMDGWALDACPHHGPGLAPAAAGGYHAVWFGERAGEQAVRAGRLDSTGAPVGTVRTLPDAEAEHADVMTHGRRVAIVWRSHDPKLNDMRLRAWLSDDDGASFTLRELGRTNEPNDHPRLAKDGAGGFHVVWRTAKEIRVVPLQP